MPQLSLYVDEATMTRMKSHASTEGVSLSKYAANAIRERIDAPRKIVDDGYWDKLYGCLADDDTFKRPAQLETKPIMAIDVI